MSRATLPAGALVVSCQAHADSPLHGPRPMALMALAAEAGGAHGIRANGPADVAAIRAVTRLPIIGIHKIGDPRGVFITPTAEAADGVVRAGADIVAVDATTRPRPDGGTLAAQIRHIHETWGVPVMADVDTLDAGLAARAAGADLVATTLAGYVGGTAPDEPDLHLVAALAERLDCPVVAEGRIRTETHVRLARAAGAHAVVVGTAITNPLELTKRFVRAMDDRR